MSRAALMLCIIAAVFITVAVSSKPKKCGPHEVLAKCGRVCEPTCHDPKPHKCPLVKKCVPGCRCADGFVRNKAGKCIRECDCDKKHG